MIRGVAGGISAPQYGRPVRGQSAALVHDVVPAADLVARLVAQTEAALTQAFGALPEDRSTPT